MAELGLETRGMARYPQPLDRPRMPQHANPPTPSGFLMPAAAAALEIRRWAYLSLKVKQLS